LFGFKAGLKSFLILATCGLFFATARLVTTDASLTFWVLLAQVSLAKLFFSEKPNTAFYNLLGLALGCGFLTKGPVAFLAPAISAIAFMAIRRRALPNPGWNFFSMLTIFAVIALPWYLWECKTHPGLLDYFLHKQIGARVASKAIHFKRFYYFLPVFFAGCFAWTAFLPAVFQSAFSRKQTSDSEREKLLFLALWFILPFIVFSLFPSKLPFYIVPLLAAFALMSGYYWAKWENATLNTRTFHLSFWIYFLSHLGLFGAGYYFTFVKTKYIVGIPSIFFIIAFCVVTLAMIVAIVLWLTKRYKYIFWLELVALAIISFSVTRALPYVIYEQSKPVAKMILAQKKEHEKVILYRAGMRALPTYLKERVIEIGNQRETFFDDPKDLEGYVFETEEKLIELLQSPERVFVVTYVSSWNELQKNTQLQLYPLMVHRRWVLFSNQK
jgi:4-amino-4-deoxy-L-arabinose transferase